jgi:hypothetical protein
MIVALRYLAGLYVLIGALVLLTRLFMAAYRPNSRTRQQMDDQLLRYGPRMVLMIAFGWVPWGILTVVQRAQAARQGRADLR